MVNINSESYRACKKCGETKEITQFASVKNGKNRSWTCNVCKYAARKAGRTDDDRAKTAAYMREQRAKNGRPSRQDEYKRAAERSGRIYRTKDEHVAYVAERAQKTKALRDAEAEVRSAERAVETEAARAARIAEKPWTDPSLSPTEQFRMRYRLDPEFKAKQIARTKRRKAESGRFAELVRAALKNQKRCPKLEAATGYTLDALRAHIESLFTAGMSWEVFFTGAIHLDHRRPVSTFDLKDPDQLRECWQLSNIQPLWASDNIRKGDAWDGAEADGADVNDEPTMLVMPIGDTIDAVERID